MELKPIYTIQEQIDKLRNRGCLIEDEAYCVMFLRNVNYYRLTAYFLPFRNDDHNYKEGTTFRQVKRIYDFDQKLRALIFAAIEEVEISIRTRLAYYHAHTYGAHGYWQAGNFNQSHKHELFISQIEQEIDRNKNALFVKHHQMKYGGKYPIWVIIELFSLGMLSRFYADMLLKDRKQIALQFNTKDQYLVSWLRSMTVLRNTCAHCERLYYSMFTNLPKIPPRLRLQQTRMLFDQILTIKLLSRYPDKWNTTHLANLSNLLKEYADSIEYKHIGFMDGRTF